MKEQMYDMYSMEEIPPILTVPEVGEFLGIGRSNAYALARSGQIEAIRIGKQFKVPRHALLKFIGALA